MQLWHYLYLPESAAAQLGFTHHGTLFGVPVWVYEADEDSVSAVPKIPLLGLYTRGMDLIFELLTFFVPEDFEVVLPFTQGPPIEVHYVG